MIDARGQDATAVAAAVEYPSCERDTGAGCGGQNDIRRRGIASDAGRRTGHRAIDLAVVRGHDAAETSEEIDADECVDRDLNRVRRGKCAVADGQCEGVYSLRPRQRQRLSRAEDDIAAVLPCVRPGVAV